MMTATTLRILRIPAVPDVVSPDTQPNGPACGLSTQALTTAAPTPTMKKPSIGLSWKNCFIAFLSVQQGFFGVHTTLWMMAPCNASTRHVG